MLSKVGTGDPKSRNNGTAEMTPNPKTQGGSMHTALNSTICSLLIPESILAFWEKDAFPSRPHLRAFR